MQQNQCQWSHQVRYLNILLIFYFLTSLCICVKAQHHTIQNAFKKWNVKVSLINTELNRIHKNNETETTKTYYRTYIDVHLFGLLYKILFTSSEHVETDWQQSLEAGDIEAGCHLHLLWWSLLALPLSKLHLALDDSDITITYDNHLRPVFHRLPEPNRAWLLVVYFSR